jgi:hypothetical protein
MAEPPKDVTLVSSAFVFPRRILPQIVHLEPNCEMGFSEDADMKPPAKGYPAGGFFLVCMAAASMFPKIEVRSACHTGRQSEEPDLLTEERR